MVNNTFKLYAIALLAFSCAEGQSQTIIDSLSIYQGQTVETSVIVQNESHLEVNSVHVTSSGRLKLSAPYGIEITEPFSVDLHGQLEMVVGRRRTVYYTYDGDGNVTGRN